MAIITGQTPVSGTVSLLTLPAGAALVVNTTSGTAYIGTSTAVTTTNSYAVSTIPTSLPSFPNSAASRLYATVASGTVAVSWMISTDN